MWNRFYVEDVRHNVRRARRRKSRTGRIWALAAAGVAVLLVLAYLVGWL